ncbi:MAG: VWA domain-containing protein [Vicinamibacterales bacterium]|jgi:VWFA-related protein
MSRHPIVRLVAGAATALFISVVLVAQSAERVLYVSVWDEHTRAPITGLGADAFAVREDGVRREVLRVTPATSPMPVAILVDNSQAATPTIADLRKALSAFVRSLDGIGPVAIIGVADRPTILRDYTTDQKQLQDGVQRVFAMPGSGATLLDAIVEVSQGLAKRDTDRVAMVIVTTENREYSTRHYRDVLEALGKGGAMMHALVLTGPGGAALNDEARNRASVLDLGPQASGGTRADVLTSQAFEVKLQELAAILKSQHRVVYSRPQTLIPPEKIEVTAAKPGMAASGAPARGQAVR